MENQDSIEIKVAMLRLNITQAQIARELKALYGRMTRATVNQVISGRIKSKRVPPTHYLCRAGKWIHL